MEDCIDSLGDAAVFSTIDCNCRYWQIFVSTEDRHKTTFRTFWGAYCYLCMPFGLRNAPTTFQRALDIILSSVRWQVCLVSLDHEIVFSKNVYNHVTHVDTVQSPLHDAGLSLKLRQYFLFQHRVEYLKHVISSGKLVASDMHIDASRSFKFPSSLRELRSFLRVYIVYKSFIKSFAAIARPLNCLMQKDDDHDRDNSTKEQLKAFNTLKKNVTSPPVLALPRAGKTYMLRTDASAYQFECTLLQEPIVTPGCSLAPAATPSTSPIRSSQRRSGNVTL